MALPALVLVHGGSLAADSWDLTVNEINRQAPELTVLAVDLPGRRSKPGELRTVTIADFVESVVADVENAGLDDIVIVAHSLAGLTIPGVVAKLGASRVREMVMAAAFVPPEGSTIVDSSPWLFAALARRRAKTGEPNVVPSAMANFGFFNGMSRARRRTMAGKLYAKSTGILVEKVSRQGMPDVPRTWILTLRDRSLSVKLQRKYIEAIGGVQTPIEMDTCHCLMVSEPERLAEILVERCQLYL